ncbi:MAG: helix-turn-helix transcriptional regulator [bacterium]|nr:helix-turn-helix transcriptional regulator [bacterium]
MSPNRPIGIDAAYCTGQLQDVIADPKAFSEELGLSLSAVYNYLNGRIPTLDVMFRIAQFCDRPIESFLVRQPRDGGTG